MPPKVISLPLKVGLSVTRITIVLSAKLAARVAGEVIHVVGSRLPSASQSPFASQSPSAEETPAAAAEAPLTDTADNVVSPIEVFPDTPIEELPDTPLTRAEADAKTIDDTDEVVAEFAEPGAEDGAGAQIDLGEPWKGYNSANVAELTARLASADAAELAVVELYERAHKARKMVLEAASRRLEELSPPDAT